MSGAPADMETASVVAISEVVNRHPDHNETASLLVDSPTTRAAITQPWSGQRADWHFQRIQKNITTSNLDDRSHFWLIPI